MVQDTLQFAATNQTVQQIAVIVQGLLLVAGAIIALFRKGK
ncbi:MAG: hypothetical protein [Arizlama microvirus]|nr:MAG: hypothetical protein [Arizlama microvirus]